MRRGMRKVGKEEGRTVAPLPFTSCAECRAWSALERRCSVRSAESRGSIETAGGRAQVRASARAVASGRDIEQRRPVRVRIRAVGNRGRVAGNRVHARNDRCRNAGSAEYQPASRDAACTCRTLLRRCWDRRMAETSATVLRAQPASVCQLGFAMYALHPLPAPLHAVSVQPRELLAFVRLVPPTAVTYCE